jgi:hypothetical protein
VLDHHRVVSDDGVPFASEIIGSEFVYFGVSLLDLLIESSLETVVLFSQTGDLRLPLRLGATSNGGWGSTPHRASRSAGEGNGVSWQMTASEFSHQPQKEERKMKNKQHAGAKFALTRKGGSQRCLAKIMARA